MKFPSFPDKRFEIVYADFPWRYYGDPNKPQAAGKHYQTLLLEDLFDLPLPDLLAPKAAVFMWATSSKLSDACLLLRHYGLHYRGVFQVWVKTTQEGKPIHGQGVRPSFTKPTSELLLVACTQPKGRVFPIRTEAMAQVVFAPRPNNEHSRKPAVFRDNILTLLGERPCIELFARGALPAPWVGWGLEAV